MHVPGIVAECTLIVARATFLGILLDAYLHPFLHTWYEEISYTFLERCHLCEGEPRKRFQKTILGGSRRKQFWVVFHGTSLPWSKSHFAWNGSSIKPNGRIRSGPKLRTQNGSNNNFYVRFFVFMDFYPSAAPHQVFTYTAESRFCPTCTSSMKVQKSMKIRKWK